MPARNHLYVNNSVADQFMRCCNEYCALCECKRLEILRSQHIDITKEQFAQHVHTAQFSYMCDAVCDDVQLFTVPTQQLLKGFRYTVSITEEYLSAIEILQKTHAQYTSEIFKMSLVSCMIVSPVLHNIERLSVLSSSIMHARILIEDVLLHRYTAISASLSCKLKPYYKLNELIQLLSLLHTAQESQLSHTHNNVMSIYSATFVHAFTKYRYPKRHSVHNAQTYTSHMCDIQEVIMRYIHNNEEMGLYKEMCMQALPLKLYRHRSQVLVHIDVLRALQVFVAFAARRELQHIMKHAFNSQIETKIQHSYDTHDIYLRFVYAAQAIHIHYMHVSLAYYSDYIASVLEQTTGISHKKATSVIHIMTNMHSISLHITERLMAYTKSQIMVYMIHDDTHITQNDISKLKVHLSRMIHTFTNQILHLVFVKDIVTIVKEKLNKLHIAVEHTILTCVVPKIFTQLSTSLTQCIENYVHYLYNHMLNDVFFIQEIQLGRKIIALCKQYYINNYMHTLHFENNRLEYNNDNISIVANTIYAYQAHNKTNEIIERICSQAYANNKHSACIMRKACKMSLYNSYMHYMMIENLL